MKKIGLVGLLGVMFCGCMSNQELKDWARGVKQRQQEKEQQREAIRREQEQDRQDQLFGHERKVLRDQYIAEHPDLDEWTRFEVGNGYMKIAEAEKRRLASQEEKARREKWEKDLDEQLAKN